jgi:hypothetical protein
VPGWSEEAREKIKSWPLQNKKGSLPQKTGNEPSGGLGYAPANAGIPVDCAESSRERGNLIQNETSKLTVGIIYYTDNLLDAKLMEICQKQLQKAADKKRIVSISLKPISFGDNVVLPLERGRLTLFRQILAGLEVIDTDVVYFCEHDVLYHPSHFNFTPPRKDVIYYNENSWFLRLADGFALHYDARLLSGLCAYREPLLRHYRERVARAEKDGMDKMGLEPMTSGRIDWQNKYKAESFSSAYPNIDIRHDKNFINIRWKQDQFRRIPANWKEANIDTVPGWSNLRGSLRDSPKIEFKSIF